jgi:hypothetical protein
MKKLYGIKSIRRKWTSYSDLSNSDANAIDYHEVQICQKTDVPAELRLANLNSG